MEIKISLKDGDKATSFKFAGDPLEVVDGALARVEKLWDAVFRTTDDTPWEAFMKDHL